MTKTLRFADLVLEAKGLTRYHAEQEEIRTPTVILLKDNGFIVVPVIDFDAQEMLATVLAMVDPEAYMMCAEVRMQLIENIDKKVPVHKRGEISENPDLPESLFIIGCEKNHPPALWIAPIAPGRKIGEWHEINGESGGGFIVPVW